MLTGLDHPRDVETRHGWLYFSERRSIGRVRFDGSEAAVLVADVVQPRGIAVTDRHVYWISAGTGDERSLQRADVDGGRVVTLHTRADGRMSTWLEVVDP